MKKTDSMFFKIFTVKSLLGVKYIHIIIFSFYLFTKFPQKGQLWELEGERPECLLIQ